MKCLYLEHKINITEEIALERNTVFHPRNGERSYFIHQRGLGNLLV